MFASALGICAAFVLLWIKLPLVLRLKMMGRPFLLDASLSLIVLVIFSGTGAGLMAATIAGLMLSILISWFRTWYGYYEYDKAERAYFYVVGKFNLTDKIIAEKRRALGEALINQNSRV